MPARYGQQVPSTSSGYLAVWLAEPDGAASLYEYVISVFERTSALIEFGVVQGVWHGDVVGVVDGAAYLLNYMTSHAEAMTPEARAWLQRAPFWQYLIPPG